MKNTITLNEVINPIGITERGDAGIDFLWTAKMDNIPMAIIITKNINDRFIKKILKYKNKVILHATITGYGGTLLEPYVPTPQESIKQLEKLINLGFNPKQIVLRVDPIIPTKKGLERVKNILNLCSNLGIKRVRFSFLDLYEHVKRRFINAGLKLPYKKYPSEEQISNCFDLFNSFKNTYSFESCAEECSYQIGCISELDVKILNKNIKLIGNKNQRKNCLCPANKLELLNQKKRCTHNCLYCYWKD